jgi:hypothetical protein
MSADWPKEREKFTKALSDAFRNLGIEKTRDEIRVMVEEDIVYATRSVGREIFETMIKMGM